MSVHERKAQKSPVSGKSDAIALLAFSPASGALASKITNAVAIVAAIGLGILAGCDRPDADPAGAQAPAERPEIPEIRLGGPAFGTSYNIRIRLDPASAAAARLAGATQNAAAASGEQGIQKELQESVHAEIESINAEMSNWHPESEISRFNDRANPAEAVAISEDFARVLNEAFRIHRISGGAFDPARDTLFALWGFGGGQSQDGPRKPRQAPDDGAIQAALQTSGMQHLRLNGSRLRKTKPGLRLNLSAIAKGHAVDRIFALLENHPLLNEAGNAAKAPANAKPAVMVEIGGEVRVGRVVDEGRPWRLGVERPQYEAGGGRSLYRIAELEHAAMATSGDYRNYFRDDRDDTLYSHIMDPRTGRPTATGVAQATVIGPDCMTADALATTLLVLGEEAGLRLIESQPQYETLLLIGQPNGDIRAVLSSGMRRWLRAE